MADSARSGNDSGHAGVRYRTHHRRKNFATRFWAHRRGRPCAGASSYGEARISIPVGNLRKALNDVLPPAIRILAAEEVAEDFHARRSARAKTYRYRIYRSEICPPFLARYVYHHPYPLNEDAMRGAAETVTGEHDFTSFAAVDPESRKEGIEINNVRTI